LQREAGEVGEDEDLQTVLDSALRIEREERGAAVTREAVRRLRCAFSELAKPAVHLEHQNPERTLHSLPAIYRTRLSRLPADCTGFPETDQKDHLRTCQHCQEFRRHNPGYLCLAHRYAYLLQDAVELATRAHLSLAQMVLTGGKIDLDRVLAHWAAAVAAARNAGAQVRTKRAIMRVILGRCEALSRESGRRRGERLTEAIDLIERARGLIGAADGGQLVATESELLTARGVWYGYGCHEYEDPDYEKGGRDLRRALELNPESLDTRDNLARALIFNAANLGHAGKRQRSFELASEAVAVLHEGLRRTRGHRQLLNMLLQTLDHLEELTLHDVSFDDLDRRLREPRGADAAPLSSRSAAAAAVRKLEAGDVSAAVTELIRVVRSSPDDDAIRQMLLDALRRKGAGSR
jgi:tetratricopeptide (TPR) repeat protein